MQAPLRMLVSCLATMALLSSAGCRDQRMQSSQRALTGQTSFPDSSCTPAEQAKLTEAMAVVRRQILDDPGPMTLCLQESFVAGPDTQPHVSDDNPLGKLWPEWLMHRLAENMVTTFYCVGSFGDGGDTAAISAAASPSLTEEVVTVTHNFADPNGQTEPMADTILHELGHIKGVQHMPSGTPEYQSTLPQVLWRCLNAIDTGNHMPVLSNGGPPRSWVGQETLLAEVGTDAGSSFEAACSGSTVAGGIYGYENSTNLQQLGLSCKPSGNDSMDQDTQAFGSALGTSFRQRCHAGEVMVGVWGYADKVLAAVGPMCVAEANVNATPIAQAYNDPAHGPARSLVWQRRCPAGMAVKTIRGRTAGQSGGQINEVAVTCQSLGNPELIDRWALPSVGDGSSSADVNRVTCPGRSAMTELNVAADANGLTRLGGFCRAVSTASSAQSFATMGAFLLPGYGSMEYGNVVYGPSDSCAQDSVLVGMRLWSGSGINGVQGMCAPLSAWTNGGAQPALTPTSIRGVQSGTFTEQICPNGYLMDGLFSQTDSHVNSLGTQCRRFAHDAQVVLNIPPRKISSISPSAGINGGGNLITITGANFDFDLNASVLVGGVPCTTATLINNRQFTCVVPAATAGTPSVADVSVAPNTGLPVTLPRAYTYVGAPKVWLNAGAGLSTSGIDVAGWSDQSGAGNDFRQISSGKQPILVTDGLNGQPLVRFNGTSNYLENTSIHSMSNLTGTTIVAVMRANSPLDYSRYPIVSDGFALQLDTGHLYPRAPASTWGEFPLPTTPMLLTTTYDSAGTGNSGRLQTWINGLAQTATQWSSTAIPSSTITETFVDIGGYNGGGYFNGDIAEVLVYDTALSDPMQRHTVECSLNAKYNLGIANCDPTLPRATIWLAADQGVTRDGSNNVSSWKDVSGGGYDASNTANQPTYSNTGINGKPSIHFPSTSTFLENAGISSLSNLPQWTIVSVFKAAGVPGGETPFFADGLDFGFQLDGNYLYARSPSGTWGAAPWTGSSTATTLYSAVFDGTSFGNSGRLQAYINGAAQNQISIYSSSPAVPSSGGTVSKFDVGYFNGDLGDVAFYQGALTTAQRRAVECSLSSKYGLTLTSCSPPAPGLAFQFKADAGVTRDSQTNRVSAWADQSGFGRHLQSSGASQPLYVASSASFNGQPTVQFDGSGNTHLENTGIAALSNMQGWTLIAVFKATNPSGQFPLYSDGSPDFGFQCDASYVYARAPSSSWVASAWNPAATTLYSAVLDTAQTGNSRLRAYVNGAAQNQIYSSALPTSVGAVTQFDIGNFVGEVGQINFYKGALSDTDRFAVECAMSAKYSLGISGCR